MIVAKTEMETMPINCERCNVKYWSGRYYVCGITKKALFWDSVENCSLGSERHSLCPLMEIEDEEDEKV